MVLLVVVTSEMVACGGREEHRKLVVATAASMLGLAVVVRGHGRAFGVDEKLPVLRGMVVVLSGSFP